MGKPEFDVMRQLSAPLSTVVVGHLLGLDEVSLSQLRVHLAGAPRPTGLEMTARRPVIESVAGRIPLYG